VIDGHPHLGIVIARYFPAMASVDAAVVPSAARYLKQALETRYAPDACVLMCASAIDAMLKDKGVAEGTLKQRIDLALEQRLIPTALSIWAHRVRLDANDTRHADVASGGMTAEDAARAIDFANAMANYLYVLPAKMPSTDESLTVATAS
jgi:hypothetical protein